MSGIESISNSVPTLAPRKKKWEDPTQNMAPMVRDFATQADALTLGKIAEIQKSRTQVSKSTLELQRRVTSLKESLDKLKELEDKPSSFFGNQKEKEIFAFKDEFIRSYRDNISELETIWGHFKERHSDIIGAGELFIPNFADHSNVTAQSIEKCIENCNLLKERIQAVDWPESDALLTTTLELNTILMRFLHEIGRELANASRSMVNNQRAH